MKRFSLLLFLFSNFTYGQVKPGTIIADQKTKINKPQHEPPVIVNVYTEVLSFDICTNTITVADASFYGIGDTVLLIQMKGALIDTSNTPAFGTVLDYKNAGNYEFNYIGQKSGNELTFLNKLTRAYDIPNGVVQLVRVPEFKNGYFAGGITCEPWDGTKGGIVAVISTIGLTSVENIDVSGKGFRGAMGTNAAYSASTCNQNNFYYPASSPFAAMRGESIGSVSSNFFRGKGNIAGGGGGGNSHNSGGGGGGNGGAGGFGGYQSDSCGAAPFDNRGIGGKNHLYSSAVNKIFMGSGGGAGHIDNASLGAPGGGFGGGIIIIITEDLDMLGERIISNGDIGIFCFSPNCNDGNSGGGAGGTILLSFTQVIDSVVIESTGGRGADMTGTIIPGGRVGPGGGGGGGVLYITKSSLPANMRYEADGGDNGVIQMDGNNTWGATKGSAGINLFDLVIPVDTILFVPNIDSVRIQDSINYCNNIIFKGLGYTNTYPVSSWLWQFGDGATANTQNTSHNYGAVGNYTVKLIITDVNGCKDSISRTINTAGPMMAEAGTDTAVCSGGQVSVTLNGSGTGSYSWSPAVYLNNNTLQNPVATISSTTQFYLSVTNGTGCSAIDSVTITVNNNPAVKTLNDTAICKYSVITLTTTGALNYLWSPGIYVSDSTIAGPQYIDLSSHTLIVTGTDANGCRGRDTILVDVKSPVIFNAAPDKTMCMGSPVQLNGNNGTGYQYLWSPASYLSNANIINPFANPPSSTVYTLTVTDIACNTDSSFTVNVSVIPLPVLKATKSNDINCKLPYARLQAIGAFEYSWTPAATLNNSSIANPVANPVNTTTYFVTGKNFLGCINKDSITVSVNFGNNGFGLPNSFTPNGDGLNDCFGINYYRDVQNLVFVIYNRYGVKVFETKNAVVCWDGYHSGQKADPGSYIYFLSARTLCGDIVKKGSVLLLR